MRKKIIIATGFFVTAAIILTLMLVNNTEQETQLLASAQDHAEVVSSSLIPQSPSAPVEPPKAVEVTPLAKVEPSKEEPRTEKPLSQILPTKQKYRDEAQKDVHSTPQSLKDFAREVAKRMASSQTSEQAFLFFDELADCAIPAEDTPKPVQEFCLEYAKKLSTKFPDLQEKWLTLKERLKID